MPKLLEFIIVLWQNKNEKNVVKNRENIGGKKMQKSKNLIKKFRNLIIFLMVIMVIIGIYFNIRNSRAEQENEITLIVTDIETDGDEKEIKVIATENNDGTFSIELPRAVDTKIVNKYIT